MFGLWSKGSGFGSPWGNSRSGGTATQTRENRSKGGNTNKPPANKRGASQGGGNPQGSPPDGGGSGDGGSGNGNADTVESLRALRSKKLARMQSMVDAAKAAKRAMDAETQAQFDELGADIRNLDARVTALEQDDNNEPDPNDPNDNPDDNSARGAYEACLRQNELYLNQYRNPPQGQSRNSSRGNDGGQGNGGGNPPTPPNRRARPIPNGSDWGDGNAPFYVRDLNDQRFHESLDQAFRAFYLASAGRMSRVPEQWKRSAANWGIAPGEEMTFELREPTARDFEEFYQRENRDMVAASSPLVPQTFLAKFVQAQMALCPLRSYCTVLTTTTGEQIRLPIANDTANVGERIAENAATASAVDVGNLSSVLINSAQYSSKPLKMSIALFEDSAIPVGEMAGKLCGDRIGRIQLTDLTNGDRTGNAPEGIAYGAGTNGTTLVAASSTVLGIDDLVNAFFALDAAYRSSPNFIWMMNDALIATLSKMKDANNQSMAVFNRSGNFRDGPIETILGKPVVPNNALPSTLTTGTYPIVLGDASTYHIRDVRGISLLVLKELFALNFEVGFLAGQRTDGAHTDKTAIKKLRML